MRPEKTSFNYIITIHNKQDLIGSVLLAVLNVAGAESHIYPVLDGCFDRSEEIIDQVIQQHPERHIHKLYANDVHELKSINIGLRAAMQSGSGYHLILQDDVLLKDKNLEIKCMLLYRHFKDLGIVSFRHGANLSRALLKDIQVIEPFSDYIQSQFGHYPKPDQLLKQDEFIFKEIVIKSPICIPSGVIKKFGLPEEQYAPWDDIAYGYKVSNGGYRNGVYALEFQSDVSWGTTRNKHQRYQVEDVMKKNLALFRQLNPEIAALDTLKYDHKKYIFS